MQLTNDSTRIAMPQHPVTAEQFGTIVHDAFEKNPWTYGKRGHLHNVDGSPEGDKLTKQGEKYIKDMAKLVSQQSGWPYEYVYPAFRNNEMVFTNGLGEWSRHFEGLMYDDEWQQYKPGDTWTLEPDFD